MINLIKKIIGRIIGIIFHKLLELTLIFKNIHFAVKYRNGVTTIGQKSPIHDWYCVQQQPSLFITIQPEKRAIFLNLYKEMRKYEEPWYDPVRIYQFMNFIEMTDNIEGDIVELGTNNGLSAYLIFKLMKKNCNLYCFDTYDGFAKTDVDEENILFKNEKRLLKEGLPVNFINQAKSPDEVREFIVDKDLDNEEKVKIVTGFFPNSYNNKHKNLKIKLLHIDFDLYVPTKKALELIWDQIVPGGIVIVHDYKCHLFPGVKKSVDEFFNSIGIVPMPMGDRQESAVVIKNLTK